MPDQVDHDAEVKEQAAIEAEVKAAKAGPSKPQQDAAKAEAKTVTVKLRSKDGDYPFTARVANSPDLVFKDANTTLEVAPEVAEQITYLPRVEVV
jgi:hypothetical protein